MKEDRITIEGPERSGRGEKGVMEQEEAEEPDQVPAQVAITVTWETETTGKDPPPRPPSWLVSRAK